MVRSDFMSGKNQIEVMLMSMCVHRIYKIE